MILSTLRAQGWKYGCLTALVLALGGWAAAGIQSYRLQVSKGAVAILARDAALAGKLAAEESTRASEAARSEELVRVKAMSVADNAYQRGLRDGKAAADNVLAGVADGTYVLRDKFRCPARSGATQAASGTGSGDGGEGAILSPADVQFLVRFASEADDAVRQLAAAQAVIRVDRGEQP